MDTVSRLLSLASLHATLDKRCLLGASTRMDVSRHVERQAPFHVVLRGSCELRVNGQTLTLQAGDIVILPGGGPHQIITPGPVTSEHGVIEEPGRTFVTSRSTGHAPPTLDLFCGRFHFGSGAGTLLFTSLPDPLHVSFGRSSDTGDALGLLSTLLRDEAQRDGEGTSAVLSSLCVVLLAMTLRTSRGAATRATIWTAAADPRIASVIDSVLADPGGDWSIDRICAHTVMSRPTLLRHFKQQTGLTVGAFVTRARLMAAADLLRSTESRVADVAFQVGYRSESAFSRAFVAEVGLTPARFRRSQIDGQRSGQRDVRLTQGPTWPDVKHLEDDTDSALA